MRFMLLIPTLLAALAVASHAGAGPARQVAIDWDAWDVPHVSGDSLEAVAYGSGWAQMEARGETVARSYLLARGEAAACFGETSYRSDLRIRQLGVPRRAAQWLAVQDAEASVLNRAFVAGMNAWLTAHPGREGPLACLGQVRDTDPLALLQVVLHVGVVAFGVDDQLTAWREARGSNAYAVAPARTLDGRALLLINPHSPWREPFLVFELHLSAPDLEAYGMTYPGLPLPVMGLSRRHGWALTFNDVDGVDLYDLQLEAGGYRHAGKVMPFETRPDTIGVKTSLGDIEERRVTLQSSLHGPVLDTANGRAVAARIAGLDRPDLVSQLVAMWRANSLGDFKVALARQQMPITNVVYADAAGETFYLFNGLSPKRSRGDRAFWAGVLDGADPTLVWTDYLPFEALPWTTNPPGGIVQNANDGPTSATWPPQGELTPADGALTSDRRTPRGRRSLRQLATAAPLDLDGLARLRASSVLDYAELARGPLTDAARASGDKNLAALAELLAGWDGSSRPDSRGAVLFTDWTYRMRRGGIPILDVDLQTLSPLSTQASLADPARALVVLREAGRGLAQRFGAADVAWGDVYRIRRAGLDLPSPVGRDEWGAFNAGRYSRVGGSGPDAGTFTLEEASTFIVEAAFSPDGVEARGLLTYGNTDDQSATAVGEQLRLFASSRLRPLALSPSQITSASRRRERLDLP